MANEATLYVQTHQPINFTVADGATIEKGTWLALTDPMTAIAHSAANQPIAGIAYREKIASNGQTKLAVMRRGIIRATLSGSCTVGDALVMDASVNMVKTAPNNITLSGANIVGVALETGTTAQTILMDLNPVAVRFA